MEICKRIFGNNNTWIMPHLAVYIAYNNLALSTQITLTARKMPKETFKDTSSALYLMLTIPVLCITDRSILTVPIRVTGVISVTLCVRSLHQSNTIPSSETPSANASAPHGTLLMRRSEKWSSELGSHQSEWHHTRNTSETTNWMSQWKYFKSFAGTVLTDENTNCGNFLWLSITGTGQTRPADAFAEVRRASNTF